MCRVYVDRTKFVSNDVTVQAVINGRVAAKSAIFDRNNVHIEFRDQAYGELAFEVIVS